MFCGVVFLLPFFLFSAITEVAAKPTTCCEWLASLLRTLLGHSDKHLSFREVCASLHHLNLSGVEFTCLAVLSIIIGTLIYHLEKNLWSYGLQIIFKRIQNKTLGCGWKRIMSICSLHVFSVLLIAATAWISGSIKWFSSITFIVIAFAAALVAIVCISNGIVEDTETMWLAEGGGDSSHKGSLLDAQGLRLSIIMSKVSTWSDFIHCGQSCALAWILGSCSAYTLFDKAEVLCGFFWGGILSSVLLLVAEGFIDWHRWQHVQNVLGEKDTAKGSTTNSALSSCMPNACKRCIHSGKTGCCILWRIVTCRIKKIFNKKNTTVVFQTFWRK